MNSSGKPKTPDRLFAVFSAYEYGRLVQQPGGRSLAGWNASIFREERGRRAAEFPEGDGKTTNRRSVATPGVERRSDTSPANREDIHSRSPTPSLCFQFTLSVFVARQLFFQFPACARNTRENHSVVSLRPESDSRLGGSKIFTSQLIREARPLGD